MVLHRTGKLIARSSSGGDRSAPAPAPVSPSAAPSKSMSAAAPEPIVASAGDPGDSKSTSSWSNTMIALVPLLPSVFIFLRLHDGAVTAADTSAPVYHHLSTRMQLAASAVIAIGGFFTTSSLVPVIAEYTRRKGLCGKDLCKRGLFADEKEM